MNHKLLEDFEFTFAENGSYALDQILTRANWYPARLPGDSIRHLREAKVETADPQRADNAKVYLPYEKCDFIYRTRFSTKPGLNYTLRCDGLDTLCDIYLNGKLIHHTENSFIRLNVDLTKYCAAVTGHELLFVFLSPTECAAKSHPEFDGREYSVVFDEPLRVLIRKPQFHYGWDNAPHLAGVGFIGALYLDETEQPLVIDDVHFTSSYDWRLRQANFAIQLSGKALKATTLRASLSYRGERVWQSKKIELKEGQFHHAPIAKGILFAVNEWQIRGYGQPHLYKMALETEDGQSILEKKIGFRDIKLSKKVIERRTVDFRVGPIDSKTVSMDGTAGGEGKPPASRQVIGDMPAGAWSKIKTEPYETDVCEFRLSINGIPVFLKGFNWQPLESSRANISDERWARALALYKDSHANILRIWGGGYIEDERLYDFCDSEGILIWQDFQFACALYPDHDAKFRDSIRQEIKDIHLRLHLHPSVGVYCGSNEIDMMLHDRGRDIRKNNTIGYDLIPETLQQLGSTTPYHVSSPSGDDYPRTPFSGETRNWTAREYVEDDYPLLRQDPSCMNTEGGAPSFPNRVLTTYFLPEEGNLHESTLVEDRVYQMHAGSTLGYDRGKGYFDGMYRNVRRCYSDWQKLDQLIYLTQLFQADALTRYVEIFRYKEERCGGCVIWKFSDLWPCVELSVVDYSLRRKMAYYAVRRVFSDTIICPFLADEAFIFSISSSIALGEASLTVEFVGMNGDVLSSVEMKLEVMQGISHADTRFARKHLREKHGLGNGLFRARLSVQNKCIAERIFLPEIMRKMNFVKGANAEFALSEEKQTKEGYSYELSITAPETLLGLNICLNNEDDVSLSDNVFHIIRGEKRVITVECKKRIKSSDIRLQTLNSIASEA